MTMLNKEYFVNVYVSNKVEAVYKVNSGTLVSDAIKTLLDNNVKTTFIISNS